MTTKMPLTSAVDVHAHLERLYVERALAAAEGLAANPRYTSDLDQEIALASSVYVGAAVTELATLRGELSGRPQG